MEENKQLMEDIKNHLNKMFTYDPKVGLNEITIIGNTVTEADNDNEEPVPPVPNEEVPAEGNADMGTPQDNADTMPPMDNVNTPQDGGEEIPAMDNVQTPEGLNPQETDITNVDFSAEDTMQPDDEVLDVTELTDAQEDMENDIKKIGGKFEKVLNAIEHFEDMIRSNDEKIENLKSEFEKRNPTQIEKLNMQTSRSYPFNVTPEEYWKEKEKNSNYSTESDNNGKDDPQYTITAQDVAGDNNWKAISDSFNSDNFMYHQTLDKILNF